MDVNAYFHRLGLEMPEKIVPDSALLRKLHLAHCTAAWVGLGRVAYVLGFDGVCLVPQQ